MMDIEEAKRDVAIIVVLLAIGLVSLVAAVVA